MADSTSDFFTRLAERTLGRAEVLQPAIAPRFATPATPRLLLEEEWVRPHEPRAQQSQSCSTLPSPSALPSATDAPLPRWDKAPPEHIQSDIAQGFPVDSAPPDVPAIAPLPQVNSPPPAEAPTRFIRESLRLIDRSPSPSSISPFSASTPLLPIPLVQSVALEPQQTTQSAIAQTTPEAMSIQRTVQLENPSRRSPTDPAKSASPPAPPTIQVHIDRIDVRAITAPSPGSASRRSASPQLSLEEYLRQRNGGPP